MSTINDYLDKGLEVQRVSESLRSEAVFQMVYDLTGAPKYAFGARLAVRQEQTVVITYGEEQARKWLSDLRSWLPDVEILYFPAAEWLSFQVVSKSRETTAERLRLLGALCEDLCNPKPVKRVVVTTVQAVQNYFFSPEEWAKGRIPLEVGQEYRRDGLLHRLVQIGYERREVVEAPGQFALRGGILDIAPLAGEPVRLEFFDEEVDSIRLFDLETQKSLQNIHSVQILPACEYVLDEKRRQELFWEVKIKGNQSVERLATLGKIDAAKRAEKKVAHVEEALKQGLPDEHMYQFFGLLPGYMKPFWHWLKPNALILLDEPLRLKEQMNFHLGQRLEEYTSNLEWGEEFVDPGKMLLSFRDLAENHRCHQVGLSALIREIPDLSVRRIFHTRVKSLTGYVKTSALAQDIADLQKKGFTIGLFAGDEVQSGRLLQGLRDLKISGRITNLTEKAGAGLVNIYPCSLQQGFELPISKLVVFSEMEIYQKQKKMVAKPKKPVGDQSVLQFSDLKPGDYVVHLHHGVGKFLGIEKITVDGFDKDYFAVKYSGEDKLYVPLEQLQCLETYIGEGEKAPKLNKLSSNEWSKTKAKAHKAVKEMAIDLVALYARRDKAKGYAYGQDTEWQREFEAKFPYEETPDQMQSILDVKRDMNKPRPMDRLLCGDVGYGKTEVALRAAFKAAEEGKQVAVLVPTTILAQQHHSTFQERFAGYPFRVEMLSRFLSVKEQKEVLRGLKQGFVDIVIGTHKLIADGVTFKDLGLLIIDEEQRFGVAHKEKIKQWKSSVDVLTLTATPIPRTLHMSMTGIRDVSIINTPPEDRVPVQTYVAEFQLDLVRDVIRRELQRNGQVFYVHNRVMSLDKVLNTLNTIVPEARCSLVHGQMSETALEREMIAFLNHERDVMICTTIIETGLDMPNVNTLIVDDADRFGLSQLYQLRGRVGRSSRKAYAYLLYQPQKVLTEEAEKRLATIREFTEFGSGFKIAMRDLEIRGAGNLIGGEQHGHMAAVGFSLYTKMLKDAVLELKGKLVEERLEPAIDVKIEALLPDDYIVDRPMKAVLYQRMAAVDSEEEISELLDEVIDRFGQLPEQVENLFSVLHLKVKARRLGVGEITQQSHQMTLTFASDPGFSGEQLMNLAAGAPLPITFAADSGSGMLQLKARVPQNMEKAALKVAGTLLKVVEEAVAIDPE